MDPLPFDFDIGDNCFDLFDGTNDVLGNASLFSDPTFSSLDLPETGNSDELDFLFGLEELDSLFDTGCRLPGQKMLELPLPSYEASSLSSIRSLSNSQSTAQFCSEILTSQPNSNARKTRDQGDRTKKRGREIIFSLESGKEVTRRGRRRFSAARKEEVARHRTIGACIQCKVRRGPCNLGMPCNHCIKRAGSIDLGKEICKRQNLVATRFDRIELFQVHRQLDIYRSACVSATTSTKFYLDYGCDTTLLVPIFVIALPHMEVEDVWSITYDYYESFQMRRKVPAAVLDWNRLPSCNDLVAACSAARVDFQPSPFYRLKVAFKEFAVEYCKLSNKMPLQSLVEECLRLHQLFVTFASLPFVAASAEAERECISLAIVAQLKGIVAKEGIICELSILSQLDKIVYGQGGRVGRQNPIGLWVALWILILSYQERMLYYMFKDEHTVSAPIHALSSHIYNTLTSIYNALFKTTSPLTLDWRKEEIYELLGRNTRLIELFSNIKTEIFWFQAVQDYLRPDDELFKRLIVQTDNRLLKAHLQKAKKQGIV